MAAASALRSSFRRVRGLHRFGTDWASRRWDSAIEKFAGSKWGDSFWVKAKQRDVWEEASSEFGVKFAGFRRG